ncbi:MAG: outer membrane porin, OprD family [Chitinophagaceae bacterium]|nr:outer membrane porin, OprD family [Chitinophagaceae bacterium]
MKRIIIAAIVLLAGYAVRAQHQEISEKPNMYKGKAEQSIDTTSLLAAFKKGHVNGHFRYFFMATNNQNGLTDYYANAVGGGLRFETAKFHGFQFAVSGFYTFNIGSSDLGKPDSITGQTNRYEIALFDVENAYNKKDIDRLEELYIKYNYKSSSVTFGRQLLNTPFINLQDGRMRPTGVEGVWFEWNEFKKIRLEGGWLYGVSPRGSTKWYSVGRSVGIYSPGVNENGYKSQYSGNLDSKGILMIGAHVDLNEYWKLTGWNVLAMNLFNTALLQADVQLPLKNKSAFYASAQLIRQDAVNNGGNADPAKTYFEKGGRSMTFGARFGWKNERWDASINYNRITATGRYLMPREWGREPFFTFMPRERNEGLGDVHAIVGRIGYRIPSIRFKADLAAGYYKLPDVKNYRLNKYGLPSYAQINLDLRYQFAGFMKGLEVQVLIAGKSKEGETYSNKKYEFNKVNMVLYNLAINYHF